MTYGGVDNNQPEPIEGEPKSSSFDDELEIVPVLVEELASAIEDEDGSDIHRSITELQSEIESSSWQRACSVLRLVGDSESAGVRSVAAWLVAPCTIAHQQVPFEELGLLLADSEELVSREAYTSALRILEADPAPGLTEGAVHQLVTMCQASASLPRPA